MKNIIKKIAFCGVLFVGLNCNDAFTHIKENRKTEFGAIVSTITLCVAGMFGLIDCLRV